MTSVFQGGFDHYYFSLPISFFPALLSIVFMRLHIVKQTILKRGFVQAPL